MKELKTKALQFAKQRRAAENSARLTFVVADITCQFALFLWKDAWMDIPTPDWSYMWKKTQYDHVYLKKRNRLRLTALPCR